MYGYIYLTTNLINGKKYIGRRKSKVFLGTEYLGSGNHLRAAVEKYGKENFTVDLIEEIDDYDTLVQRETYWIKFYDAVNSEDYYNHSYGGYHEGFVHGEDNVINIPAVKEKMRNSRLGQTWSEEQHIKYKEYCNENHEKLSERAKVRYKNMSEETKKAWIQKLSEHSKKQVHTKERDEKVRQSRLGSKMMNNGVTSTWVRPEHFEEYLKNGYVFGGLSRNRDYSAYNNPMYGKRGVDNPNHGRVAINNGKIRKKVKLEELDSYLNSGWKLGHKI